MGITKNLPEAGLCQYGSTGDVRSEEWEELLDFVLFGFAAVFTNFKRLGVTDLLGMSLPVKAREHVAESFGRLGVVGIAQELFADLLLPCGDSRSVLGFRDKVRPTVAAAFVELGFQGLHGRDLPLDNIVDINHNVWRKRVGPLELVIRKEKHGVLREIWSVRTEMRDRDHERSIHDQHPDRTMVRVIVVWAMAEDEVCLPVTDQAADRPAVLKGRHEFTVVDVEHFGLGSQDFRALADFCRPSLGEWPTRHAPVADVPVGA